MNFTQMRLDRYAKLLKQLHGKRRMTEPDYHDALEIASGDPSLFDVAERSILNGAFSAMRQMFRCDQFKTIKRDRRALRLLCDTCRSFIREYAGNDCVATDGSSYILTDPSPSNARIVRAIERFEVEVCAIWDPERIRNRKELHHAA